MFQIISDKVDGNLNASIHLIDQRMQLLFFKLHSSFMYIVIIDQYFSIILVYFSV
jgi:hypothetical protein